MPMLPEDKLLANKFAQYMTTTFIKITTYFYEVVISERFLPCTFTLKQL